MYVIMAGKKWYFTQSDIRNPKFMPHQLVLQRGTNRCVLPDGLVQYPTQTAAEQAIQAIRCYGKHLSDLRVARI